MRHSLAILLVLGLVAAAAALADTRSDVESVGATADSNAAESSLGPLDGGSLAAGLARAELLLSRGDSDGAAAVLNALHREFPLRPEPLNNLAALYAGADRLDDARELLERAIGAHPGYRIVHANLAEIYQRLAARAYARALPEAGGPPDDGLSLETLEALTGGPECELPASPP